MYSTVLANSDFVDFLNNFCILNIFLYACFAFIYKVPTEYICLIDKKIDDMANNNTVTFIHLLL